MAPRSDRADLSGYFGNEKCRTTPSEADTTNLSGACRSDPNNFSTARVLDVTENDSGTATTAPLNVSGKLAGRRKAQKGPEGRTSTSCT